MNAPHIASACCPASQPQHSRIGTQRGSILVNAAIALSLIVIILIGTELGYMFYLKRAFQKSADLAALAGAQTIQTDSCTNATSAAIANAAQNLPSGFQLTAADIVCGRWDPATLPAPRHFSAGVQPFNAVQVSMQRTPPLLMPNIPGNAPRTIAIEALAVKVDPSAAFSVGSRLLRFSGDSTLGALLKAIGLNLDGTDLLSYEGLATVSITPGGLLCALNLCADADITVGGLNDLLNANVTLGQLLDAVVTAGGHGELLGANVTLINALKAKLGVQDLNLQLGSANGNPGLFALITTLGANSALEANINALDLIQAAVGVATGGHAFDAAIPVNLGLLTVTSKVGIVEPPSIAIGTKGVTAYTAQVRTYLQVQTAGLLAALVKLNLPIVLDLVTATAKLEDLCTPALVSSTGQQQASFDVQGTILKGCIGRIANSSGSQDCSLAVTDPKHQACLDDLIFSKKEACDQNLSNVELLNVLGLIKATNSVSLDVLPLEEPTTITLAEGQTGTAGNDLALGTTVTNLVNAITDLLFNTPPPTGNPTQADIANAANQIWNTSGNSVADGGAGCTDDTTACRAKRLSNAQQQIATSAAQSGLVDSVLNGIGNLLGAVGGLVSGDGCSYTGLLGGVLNPTSNAGCVNLIQNTLKQSTSSPLGGVISNTLAVVTGLLQPLLDAIGSSLLTPLLQNLLGIHLGEVDVKLQTLQCHNAQLVY